jgi:DNA-binding NtrC family response regulator
MADGLPTLLVIDDVLGRAVADGFNQERANLCAHFLLRDITGDQPGRSGIVVKRPIAEAFFVRGQTPKCARVNDTVSNDIESVVAVVREGLQSGAAHAWNLVLLDLSFYTGVVTVRSNETLSGMPEGREHEKTPEGYFGLEVLEKLHRTFPDLPIVILSSRSRVDVALQFARSGALGFIDSDADDGHRLLADAIDRHALLPDSSGMIIGHSLELARTLRLARRSARTSQNILIRGESGVGKELIAAYVNRMRRTDASARPFCIVNSGSLSGDLYYSELFGHVKGAFTDAQSRRIGMIEQADGGDLFLDEVANMPPAVQNGLLRVLEEGVITPLGGGPGDVKNVRVRFITATHANLELMIAEGRFREDLYERLHRGGLIFVPALRNRAADIPALMECFVRQAERDLGAQERLVSAEARAKCQAFSWPRNVRQLQNCLYQAVSNYPDLEHLLAHHIVLPGGEGPPPDAAARATGLAELLVLLRTFDFETLPDDDLRGLLSNLERSFGTFVAHYLSAVLSRHRRPDERLPVQPAIQFASGLASLSTTAAYDVIKRIARRTPGTDFHDDKILAEALERSIAGRSAARMKPRSASDESDD